MVRSTVHLRSFTASNFNWMARHCDTTHDEEAATGRPSRVQAQSVANRIFDLLPPDRLKSMSRCNTLCRIYRKSELLTEEPDEDYIVEDDDEPVYGSKKNPPLPKSVEDILQMMVIEGSVYLQDRIKENRGRFSILFFGGTESGTGKDSSNGVGCESELVAGSAELRTTASPVCTKAAGDKGPCHGHVGQGGDRTIYGTTL